MGTRPPRPRIVYLLLITGTVFSGSFEDIKRFFCKFLKSPPDEILYYKIFLLLLLWTRDLCNVIVVSFGGWRGGGGALLGPRSCGGVIYSRIFVKKL